MLIYFICRRLCLFRSVKLKFYRNVDVLFDEIHGVSHGAAKLCSHSSLFLSLVKFISVYVPIGSMYAIYGNMDPINIPPMLAYIPYMDPMGYSLLLSSCPPPFDPTCSSVCWLTHRFSLFWRFNHHLISSRRKNRKNASVWIYKNCLKMGYQ